MKPEKCEINTLFGQVPVWADALQTLKSGLLRSSNTLQTEPPEKLDCFTSNSNPLQSVSNAL